MHRGELIGEIVIGWNGLNQYSAGEVVIFRDCGDNTATVERPLMLADYGSSGFIATRCTTICVPINYVRPLDPRDDRIKLSSR